jgi:hypothetical protein
MLVMGSVTLALLGGVAAAAEGERCLRYRDLDGLTKVDAQTLIARTKSGPDYKLALDPTCRYLDSPGNFFITSTTSTWECVEPGDALPLNQGGVCFVQSVTKIEKSASK